MKLRGLAPKITPMIHSAPLPTHVTVVGTGYVGLSLAVLLARHHAVKALDIDAQRVERINQKKSPIHDPLIEKTLDQETLNLLATTDASTAYADAQFVIVAT
ncbi:MAG: hypothetical protein RL307_1301, partial [Pseudomonadota bacterium]